MIRTAYNKGARDAFALLEIATIPAARIVAPGSGVRTPTPTPAPTPTTLPAQDGMPAATVQSLPPTPSPAMQAVKNVPGRVSSMMRPMRKAVGLAALGGAGALAYGMHRQHADDQERQRNLVYAPLPGSVMG